MNLLGIAEQGLILGFVALGVFMSFRVIDLADLTPDGSYVLGGAVTVSLLYRGIPWYYAIICAFIITGISGFFTAVLYNKFKMNSLLASILIMTMLYSVNLRIMDGPNISVPKDISEETVLYSESTSLDNFLGDLNISAEQPDKKENRKTEYVSPFNNLSDGKDFLLLLIILLFSITVLSVFLKTDFGILLRGYGGNKEGVTSLGVNKNILSITGLFIGNGFAGISGGIFSLYAGFSDVNMGQGIVVTSLAAIIIGEILISRFNILYNLLCPVVGAVVYEILLSFAMKYGYKIGFQPGDIKLLTSFFIVIVIGFRTLEVKKWLKLKM
ncbi:MAG: ABC transporter permease [Thermotogae bacterium]|nr:ABC transporter permease [Thermotogota bacterium]